MIKPLASEEKRLVKRLRTGTTGPIAYSGTEQPEGMVDTPAENLLKEIIKGVNKDPTVPIIINQEATTSVKQEAATPVSRIKNEPQPSTSGVKKTPKSPKPLIPPKQTTSKSGGLKKTVLSGATKGVLKSLGLRYSDDEGKGGYSPKGKGKKKYPKTKKTTLQSYKRVGKTGINPPNENSTTMTQTRKKKRTRPPLVWNRRRGRLSQLGRGVDIQKWLGKTKIEFHWPGYQYMGPGTKLKKRLARGDPGINRLDRLAKQHDIDYSKAKNLQDKWKADAKMIKGIDNLPVRKTMTERVVKQSVKHIQ